VPDKYHIQTRPVTPRRPRIGKFGIVDWREDCCRCHHCVKNACVYDRYRQEAEYIRHLRRVDALFFDCMGCFCCVQECTKGLLCMGINPVYEGLGNCYWTPDIIRTTWAQAETAKIPVSGAGYRGPFSGPGFDGMWTDMSEIVRPTRDGIHGREYISTAVDIGRKPGFLGFDQTGLKTSMPPLVMIQMPLIIDLQPAQFSLPDLRPLTCETARRTDTLVVADATDWAVWNENAGGRLTHVVFHIGDGATLPEHVLREVRLVEVSDGPDVAERIAAIKKVNPDLVVCVRVVLDGDGCRRAVELAQTDVVDVLHIRADLNGNEIGVERPRFLKEMIREVHTALIDSGRRDEITLIAGGGIALPEHMAKAIICGADLVSVELPLMVGLECHLCDSCRPGLPCPAELEEIDPAYGVGRMTNLIAAWHDQLIEVMGAMGMREVRRLRGDVGRCMFFEQLEEETFGKLFGRRKNA